MTVSDDSVQQATAAEPGSAVRAAVEVRDVKKRFGDTDALTGVSLDFPSGSFISILGPSGCGKTTLLRIIAGLEYQDSGTIAIDGADVSKTPPHKRPVNLVFQRYALFPHKTVFENVAFSLRLGRTPGAEIKRRVEDMLNLVHLPGYGDRSIQQLSGGQAQRVALARALVTEPPVLLLDEPLTALDLKLRQKMQVELREIQRRVGSTFIYVTHDQTEALVMSDQVVLMNHGEVVQQGPPREVYDRPTALFSATFLGEANLLPATVGQGGVVSSGSVQFSLREPVPSGQTAGWVCVRPEHVRLTGAPAGQEAAPNSVAGTVQTTTFVGPTIRYTVDIGGGASLQVEAPAEREVSAFAPGAEVVASWHDTAPMFVPENHHDAAKEPV